MTYTIYLELLDVLDLCSLPLVAQNDKGKYSVSLTNNVHVHEKTSKNITESQDRQNLKACKLNL